MLGVVGEGGWTETEERNFLLDIRELDFAVCLRCSPPAPGVLVWPKPGRSSSRHGLKEKLYYGAGNLNDCLHKLLRKLRQ